MNIAGFEKIAPYLTHPLVLAGFELHKEAQAQKSNKEAAADRHLGALAYMNNAN